MNDFKKGDVVVLKSGGPAMTIEDIGDYSSYGDSDDLSANCVWFENKKRENAVFGLHTLKLAETGGE
ncbi:YodC family protein [Cupriavidus oxalaticus]|uniref:YodC family protein n=1 Tax=Cupriavidus oxalaticus TaxID=96344 RepID=UPI00317EBAC6